MTNFFIVLIYVYHLTSLHSELWYQLVYQLHQYVGAQILIPTDLVMRVASASLISIYLSSSAFKILVSFSFIL